MKVEDYVGPATLEKMKQTKWYALARFIDELLYDGKVAEVTFTGQSYPKDWKRFVTSDRIYVGKTPEHIKIAGRDGEYFDTEKALRELMHECERMAVKEVT